MVFYGKKIKVCHVIPTLRFGGAEKLVILFAKHFDPTRFELTVATIIESGPLSADLRMMGSRHAEFHKRGLGLRLLFNLYRFFRAEKFDVVHTHLFGGDAWGRLAAWLARTPVIISTEHNFNLDEGRLKHFWKWFSQGMIDKEVAVSEAVKNYSIEVDKINPRKIIVIRNGIEVERFSRLPTVHFGAPFILASSAAWKNRKDTSGLWMLFLKLLIVIGI